MMDDVELEHRLTSMENSICRAVTAIEHLSAPLASLVIWRDAMDREKVHAAGVVEGRAAIRRMDMAILAGVVAIVTFAASNAPTWIKLVRG